MWRKIKLSHYTLWRRFGERRYSSYSFMTSAIDGCEWSRPDHALPPEKGPPVPIVQEAGGGGDRAGMDREVRGKILFASTGDRTFEAEAHLNNI
jgi:hypothetical protein